MPKRERVAVYITDKAWKYLKEKAGLPTDHQRQNANGLSAWLGELLSRNFEDTRPQWKLDLDLQGIQTIDEWIITPHPRKQRILTMATSDLIMATLISKNKNIIPKHKNKIGPFLGAILECVGQEDLTPDYWPPPLRDTMYRRRSLKLYDEEDRDSRFRALFYMEHVTGEVYVQYPSSETDS